MRISSETGLAARPGEPNAIFETFIAGHLPPEAPVDGASYGVSPSDPSEEEEEEDSLF
jgi:hypothetical protein